MGMWKGLIYKEISMMQTFLWVSLGVGVLVIIIGYTASMTLNYFLSAISFALLIMHVFYLPVYILTNLAMEHKRHHLWLHHPAPAWKLLIVKFLPGLCFMFISYGVVLIVFLFQMPALEQITIIPQTNTIASESLIAANEIFIFVLVMTGLLFFGSFYIALWCLLAWVVYQVFKNRIGFWSWLVIAALISIPVYWLEKLEGTKIYANVILWGEFVYEPFRELTQDVESLTVQNVFYMGEMVYYAFLIIILFGFASWLMDRRVEV